MVRKQEFEMSEDQLYQMVKKYERFVKRYVSEEYRVTVLSVLLDWDLQGGSLK